MNAPRDSKGTGDTQNKYSQSNAIVVYSPLPYTSDNEMVRTKWNDSILTFLNGLHKRKSHGSIKSRLCHLRTTLRAVGFSYAKRERNHCEQPSAFLSSMRELVTPHVMHLMSSSVVNNFFAGSVSVQKNQSVISPKALTKKRLNSHCIFAIILRK